MAHEWKPQPPKLPVQQLAILVVARLAEPIADASIYPYLPEMIRDFGIPENEVAKWAGLTAAVFAVAQAISAVPWGKASDRYGRKPIILCGLVSTMICFLLWGMSTSLPMAIAVRAIQGVGNGNVPIIRTVVAELVPERELQPRAYSIMPLVWSVGSILGPAFGGFLSQPARKYPGLFGNMEYFKRFPYALPNLVAAVFFLVSAVTTALYLRETLPSKRGQPDWGVRMGRRVKRALGNPFRGRLRESLVDIEATAPLFPGATPSKKELACEPGPGMRDIFTRQTTINLICYMLLAFHTISFDQNITVLLHHPVQEHTADNTNLPFYFSGGFGLRSNEIGTIFTIYGIASGVAQLTLLPPLVKRLGVLRCCRVACILLPLAYLATPYASLLPTKGTRIAAIMAVLMLKGFSTVVVSPCAQILLNNSCSSMRVPGTVNGLATLFSGVARAVGPASTGITFSWGVDNGCIVSAYFFLALVAVVGAVPAFMAVECEGPSAATDKREGAGATRDRRFSLPDESAVADDEADVSSPLLGSGRRQGATYKTMNGHERRGG